MLEFLRDRAVPAAGLASVLLIAGCTTDGSSPIATPTLAPATPTAAATTPPCSSDIRVIPGEVEGAAGHRFLVLVFNNVGSATCTLGGYPKVDLVDASGNVVKHVKETLRGQAGLPEDVSEPPTVQLAAGKSASAAVEASAIPEGDGPECTTYALMVTPPGQKRAVSADPAEMPDCDIQVHPVVAGDQRTR
jgi:hypothetical protein